MFKSTPKICCKFGIYEYKGFWEILYSLNLLFEEPLIYCSRDVQKGVTQAH